MATAVEPVATDLEEVPESPAEETPTPPTTLTGEAPAAESTDGPEKGPVEYELKLPENSVLDESALEKIAAYARANGLSNEAAQAQVELLNGEVASSQAAYLESIKPGGAEWTQRVTEWEETARKDPEIGGTPEKFDASVNGAKKALRDFADPALTAFLHDSGLGSHPMVIRLLSKIAKATSEGSVIPSPAPNAVQRSDAEKLYDHPTSRENSNA